MNSKRKKFKITWSLEMNSSKDFKSKNLLNGCKAIKLEIPLPILNRFFYESVGELWNWTDRISWSDKIWENWVNRENLLTWILLFRGTPAGYFELVTGDNEVEIAYFGLLPQFLNKGLGGGFLSYAIKKAWEQNKKRIWVHTCSLDHPNALNNYKSRGMQIFKTEILNI